MSGMRALCCGGRGGAARGPTDRGMFLSYCGPGVGAVCPVVDMYGLCFRVYRSVWLVVRGAVCEDAGIRL